METTIEDGRKTERTTHEGDSKDASEWPLTSGVVRDTDVNPIRTLRCRTFESLSLEYPIRLPRRRWLVVMPIATATPTATNMPTERIPAATTDASGRAVSALLVPLRLFLAAGWLRAGVEKVIDPDWWTGEVLDRFLAGQRPHMLPFFRSFSDALIQPLAMPVAWLVVGAQIAIGMGLLLGRFPRRALWAGLALNVCFTAAGRVNPSAFYLVMELALLIGLSRPTNLTIAWRRATLWLVPVVLALPFARTLAPAAVIDDPALMIAFVCGLAAVTTIAWSAAHLRFPVDWVDLLPRAAWSDAARRRLERFRQTTA